VDALLVLLEDIIVTSRTVYFSQVFFVGELVDILVAIHTIEIAMNRSVKHVQINKQRNAFAVGSGAGQFRVAVAVPAVVGLRDQQR
jgi:hypothetical protein